MKTPPKIVKRKIKQQKTRFEILHKTCSHLWKINYKWSLLLLLLFAAASVWRHLHCRRHKKLSKMGGGKKLKTQNPNYAAVSPARKDMAGKLYENLWYICLHLVVNVLACGLKIVMVSNIFSYFVFSTAPLPNDRSGAWALCHFDPVGSLSGLMGKGVAPNKLPGSPSYFCCLFSFFFFFNAGVDAEVSVVE